MNRFFCFFRLWPRFISVLPLLAACAVSAGSTACSDREDAGLGDRSYVKIVSQAFTFDETDPANNRIFVESNAAWEAVWTPADAAVTVSPVSGVGDGAFAVTDMPQGTTVQFFVRTAKDESNSIAVTRGVVSGEYTLVVTPLTVEYSATDPAANVITVKSNTAWTAVPSDPGLKVSPLSGTGDGTISVTEMTAGQCYTLMVTAGQGAEALEQQVTVTRRSEAPVETVFSLDFGTTASEGWANQSSAWQTQGGTGAATVTYAVNNVRIREDNYGSAGKYAGASGRAYAKMFYEGSTDYFVVQDITLPVGEKDFTLTFGALFPENDVVLSVCSGDSPWRTLTYTGAAVYNTWAKVTVGFSLKSATDKLSIRLAPNGTVVGRAYGLNFDDVTLTTGGGGQQVDVGAANDRWAELPSNFETPSADQFVHTTWTTTVTSHKRVRNYTYCYDTRRHNPVWVAYPHHRCYLEGSGRSEEPWAADPALDPTLQSKIYASSTGDVFQYWTADLITARYGSGYWSRGHLCMSRERPGKGLEINMQTFRPTNVAPQASAPSPFGDIWGNIETAISGGTIPADTLYIVAGCYYEEDNWVEQDGSNNGNLCADSKDCMMPTHQFKMAVRKKTVQVGKPVQECRADELQTIAFWVETLTQSTATSMSELEQFVVPVSFVEEKMQIKFFPEIPDAAKRKVGSLADWGY